jgi:hypothetical protein
MRVGAKWLLSAILVLSCCSNEYEYVPVATSSSIVARTATVDFPIPQEAPTGDVRLAVVGVTRVRPAGAAAPSANALRLRMIVTNNGPETWTIDEAEQSAFVGAVQLQAVNAIGVQAGRPALVQVGPGTRQTLDFSFVLPPSLQNGANRRKFTLVWRLHAPTGSIERRATFERLRSDLWNEDESDVSGSWGGSSSPSR